MGLQRWAGRLIVLYGAAHTLGALLVEGAAEHLPSWLRGELAGDSLATMTPGMSAYWLSLNSFGPALVLVGLLVASLAGRGVVCPPYVAWALIGWVVLGLRVLGLGVGQDLVLVVAAVMLLVGAHRHRRAAPSAPTTAGTIGA